MGQSKSIQDKCTPNVLAYLAAEKVPFLWEVCSEFLVGHPLTVSSNWVNWLGVVGHSKWQTGLESRNINSRLIKVTNTECNARFEIIGYLKWQKWTGKQNNKKQTIQTFHNVNIWLCIFYAWHQGRKRLYVKDNLFMSIKTRATVWQEEQWERECCILACKTFSLSIFY